MGLEISFSLEFIIVKFLWKSRYSAILQLTSICTKIHKNKFVFTEQDALSRKEKEDSSRNKWLQAQDEKRKKIEENKLKDDAHRKEVELRKKQQREEEKVRIPN